MIPPITREELEALRAIPKPEDSDVTNHTMWYLIQKFIAEIDRLDSVHEDYVFEVSRHIWAEIES